jgi:dipeptidyl-peptidase-4
MPLREPKELQEKLTRLELPSPEFIQISIPSESLAKNAPETTQQTTQDQNQPITAANTSTVQLDAWQILPKDFARREKVPVIIFVYGEPAGQTVLDAWGGDRGIWHAALAKRGFAVFSIDNRGTPAPKGRAWRKSIYGQVGVLASADQANALKALLAKYPQLDANRVAIWGWSGGGSMTLNALFRYPDLYQRGVSIAPVPNQLYYDTIYQERYMGLPSDNAEGYRRGSPISFASQLKGELLLIHGTGDDNCHYQTTELLINELIAQKKIFRMFAYPNRSHSINEGRGTTEHLFQTVTDFLLEGASP